MNRRESRHCHAFTLIELLVVIAIIGIIAAMVVNMNSAAQTAKRNAQVNGDKANLTLMIDNYHAKLNFYPPDNGSLASALPANYEALAAINPLLYELTGASINPATGNIVLFDGTNISSQNFSNWYGRASVNNANPEEPDNFFNPGPQPKEYTNYDVMPALKGLLVPVPGAPTFNFWHYDSSTTNRHNLSSYDLWAEYISATRNGVNIITINGNW